MSVMRIWRRTLIVLHRHCAWWLMSLLVLQSGLLAWTAFANSPVVDEIAHLPAGLSHWKFQRFDLYRVNPPLVRTIAAIPVLFSDCQADWGPYQSTPLAREEFDVGRAFVSANGFRYFHYVSLARLACIPFSWLGALVCFLWARDLSGKVAGLFAAALWVVSPWMLAHGALITPDAGAASLGVLAAWRFWKWLRHPSWSAAGIAGVCLGLAQLTKTTWLILFVVWPAVFLICHVGDIWRQRLKAHSTTVGLAVLPACLQLAAIMLSALYVLNAGYLFEGTLRSLGSFQFRSVALSGQRLTTGTSRGSGNRFSGSLLRDIPVPLPASFVEGIDLQKLDFETGQPAYLRGEWRDRGWWYYYLYALFVKTPLGTILMAVLALVIVVLRQIHSGRHHSAYLPALFLPPLSVLVLVSMQTGLNKHARYVLPALPFVFVLIAAVFGRLRVKRLRYLRPVFLTLLVWTTSSSLRACPLSLTYFNELAGGPENGAFHLLDSNLDWGQGLLALKKWNDARTDNLPLYVSYSGLFDPAHVGINCRPVPTVTDGALRLPRGHYAISVNQLFGEDVMEFLRNRPSTRVLQHSIAMYKIE